MHSNRRRFMQTGLSGSALVASPALFAQAKGGRKLLLGQSVPLTGAADQIGLAYFNGAKMYFDAINAKNGVAGYKIEVKTLDDGYNATKAAANAKQLLDEGADALFGFAGTASCDAAYAVTKASGTPFFAPFAASDSLHDAASSNAFHVRPASLTRPTKSCATAPRSTRTASRCLLKKTPWAGPALPLSTRRLLT